MPYAECHYCKQRVTSAKQKKDGQGCVALWRCPFAFHLRQEVGLQFSFHVLAKSQWEMSRTLCVFSFHFVGTLPLGFTTWKHFLCGLPEVTQVLYAKLELYLLSHQRCVVLHWWKDNLWKKVIEHVLFLVLKATHYWSLRDLWEGYRKGFVFRIYTLSSHAGLNNITIENCASVGCVS